MIVLAERVTQRQPKGRCGAAAVLTGDDVGALKGEEDEHLRIRAHQNVVLELGYVLGKPRRARVGILYEEGVEHPSDMTGMLYIPPDAGMAYRMEVARELRARGIKVDTDALV